MLYVVAAIYAHILTVNRFPFSEYLTVYTAVYSRNTNQQAWNDFDTVPRHTLSRGLEDHGGSRRRLLFTRKQKHTIEAHTGLEQANAEKPRLDARRFCIITNPANENA